MTNINLPEGENEFFETLKLYFPNIYDVKYLMKSCKALILLEKLLRKKATVQQVLLLESLLAVSLTAHQF